MKDRLLFRDELRRTTEEAKVNKITEEMRRFEEAEKKCKEAMMAQAKLGLHNLDFQCEPTEAEYLANAFKGMYLSSYEDEHGKTHIQLRW